MSHRESFISTSSNQNSQYEKNREVIRISNFKLPVDKKLYSEYKRTDTGNALVESLPFEAPTTMAFLEWMYK